MANKRITTELVVKAVDEYSKKLGGMSNITGKFASKVRTDMGGLQKLRGPLLLIQDYKKAQSTFSKSEIELEKSRVQLKKLRTEMKATSEPTKKMVRDFDRAQKAAEKLRLSHVKNKTELAQLQGKLRSVGVNTGDLAGEQGRLTSKLNSANAAFAQQAERLQRMRVLQDRLAESRRRMDKTMARAANMSFVGSAAIGVGRRILSGTTGVATQSGERQAAFTDFQNLSGASDERMSKLRGQLSELRGDTKQSVDEMLIGLSELVGKGMDLESALGILPATMRAAFATDTSSGEMGAAGFALFDNLKLDPEEMARAYDVMAKAGKEGGFELTAMARKFPEVTAGARGLKMEGLDAVGSLTAALQIAMKSAGSEDQAATNMANFFGKITAPDTVRKFKKFGVNVEAEMTRAMESGVDPMEHMLSVIERLTGGDAFKMGELFADKQVLDFLKAMLPNMEEYRRIKEEALSANGVVDQDLERKMREFKVSTGQFGRSVRELFTLPPEALDTLTALVKKSEHYVNLLIKWKDEHPKFSKAVFLGATALGALAVAGGAVLTVGAALLGTVAVMRFGLVGLAARAAFAGADLAGLAGSMFRVGRASNGLSKVGSGLAVFGGRAPKIRAVSFALRGLSGVVGLPVIGAAIAGVATVIGAISAPLWGTIAVGVAVLGASWRYWDRVSAIALGVASAVGSRLRPVIEAFGPVMEKFAPMLDLASTAFSGLGRVVSSAMTSVTNFFSGGLFSREILSDEDAANLELRAEQFAGKIIDGFVGNHTKMFQAGRDLIVKFWNGVEAEFKGFMDWLGTLPGMISKKFGSIDLKQSIKWPQLPEWLRTKFGGGKVTVNGGDAPQVAGHRALGGPVRAGYPYMVNERTPNSEIMVPSVSGGVLNVAQSQAVLRDYLFGSAGSRRFQRGTSGLKGGAQGVRMAALASMASGVALGAAASPADRNPGPTSQRVSLEINGGIHVTAPAGVSDPEGLVDALETRLSDRISATLAASFSD